MSFELDKLILSSLCVITWHHQLLLQWRQRRQKGRGKRRWWIRPINKSKEEQGYRANLLRELETQDHEEFFKNLRMWPEHFNWLLDRVREKLQKRSRRTPLDLKLRLQVTLLYLAQGDSILSKHTEFRIGKSTVHAIIPETCQAIWEALQPIFLPVLDDNLWKRVADGFMDKWQYPNCLGAIDGKHVHIKAPPISGSEFYNYNGFFSIVLLGACDAEYKFTWVDIGQYDSLSDGNVWSNTDLMQALEEGTMNLPPPTPLPGTDVPFPYTFVADEAFPLSTYMMRPFPKKNVKMSDDERIFNYRLSRARRVIENTFGIMGAKWQILNSCISCSPKNSEQIIKALVCLHNFMMTCERVEYCPPGFADTEHNNGEIQAGAWRAETNQTIFHRLDRIGANRSTRIAYGMRNHLMQYFVSEIGQEQAPWQYERALCGHFINLPD